MKLSFWRKTAAVLMAVLLALSTPVLALSETLEAAATAEPTAAPAATVTPVVTEAPVETEATTAPEATTVPEATETAIVTEDPAAMETPVAAVAPAVVNAPMAETTPVPTPPIPRAGNLASEQLVFHCTTDETHADQVSNGGSYYKYDTGSMTYDEARGVWTATMKVTNIQTLLTFGRICPDKVWGKKHYHTDENGNTVRMATVTVVWNAETSKWEPEGGAYVINVWCPTKPSKPTLPTNSTGSTRAITVKDSSNPASEKLTYFRYLKTGTYSFGEVTKDEQGTFWCDLTITDLDYYVQEFNTAKNVSYKIDPTANNSVFVYKFKYIGSSDYKQDGSGWTLDASSYDVSKGETSKTGKVLYVTSLYTVTYTDGVSGEAFEDQVYSDLLSGLDTPAFNGTPARKDYVFMGWNPAVTDKVTESVIYTAQWELDENGNGIPDKEEERYSVTYTDGVSGEAFEDQVYSDLLEGLNTPEFNGTPECKGYVFAGWQPEVAKTVSGNATYTAKWDEDKNNNGKPDKDEQTYTVIYTDGVADEEVFADQKTEGLLEGLDTPAFNGTPERKGYVFAGWQPEVAKTVSGNATYTALWTADKNGNGVPDDQEEHFTVTYTDGTKKHTAFADQVFTGLVKGEATPSFDGKPTRKGYKFLGWKPEVAKTVSGNATYTAKWAKIEAADEDEVPKTGDTAASSMATMLTSLACMGLAVMLLLARSKAQKNR